MGEETVSGFLDELDLRYLDGVRWLVQASFRYHLHTPDGKEFVRLDVGSIINFASIPRPLKLFWPSPGGKYDKPAGIHDELYVLPFVQHVDGTARRIERDEADDIFNEAMGVMDVGGWTRRCLYRGVRVGGGGAWDRYREAEAVRVA